MIKPLLKKDDFIGAAQKMDELKPYFDDNNQKFNKLYKILTTQGQIVESESISDLVNTKESMEYAPIISADGNTLLLCRNSKKNFTNNENIHISQKKDGKWQEAVSIQELSTYRNEAPEALSADGNSMILFVEGKICSSEKRKTGWSTPQPLSNAVNKNFWQADARITADGNALLFASGSSVYADDIDIFVSVKDEDGNWTQAHGLGNIINTNKADRAPYLHPDMKTLYFCSKGHVGIGEFDVFVSKRLDDTWTNWSDPVNLGIGINTVNNEWEFKVTTDGKKGYFSKESSGGDIDIFITDLPDAYQPDKVATISGKLKGIDGGPISAEIQWEDLETGEIVQITRSDPVTGEFFATLPELGRFGYSIKHPEFFPLSGNVDLTEGVKDLELEEDMVLATVEEMKENEVKLKLNNLFFETAKYDIKPTSYPELNRLSEWILTYNLSIEILGHTDNVGEDTDNQLLSENRAKAVKAYLVEKGCPGEKIIALGFGEKQPVASNNTAKGRALNRRVEIKISD
jgi:outer membrane protein OmpA-like peptidoglycan-associated protein